MIEPYNPTHYKEIQGIEAPSAWKGLEKIIPDIMQRFNVANNLALEFGVEFGYSTSIFSQLFNTVIGVDTFKGDEQSGVRENGFLEQTKNYLKDYKNITLIESDFKEYISKPLEFQPDLIHIDIEHTFQPTYKCGKWAVKNCKVVIFHDTESFPPVKQALEAISNEEGLTFYNYQPYSGLGILVKQ